MGGVSASVDPSGLWLRPCLVGAGFSALPPALTLDGGFTPEWVRVHGESRVSQRPWDPPVRCHPHRRATLWRSQQRLRVFSNSPLPGLHGQLWLLAPDERSQRPLVTPLSPGSDCVPPPYSPATFVESTGVAGSQRLLCPPSLSYKCRPIHVPNPKARRWKDSQRPLLACLLYLVCSSL